MIPFKQIELYKSLQDDNPGYVILLKSGIFYRILQEEAARLAPLLSLKLMAVEETSPGSSEKVVFRMCGFPASGLNKYVGMLARAGLSTAICENGTVVEKVTVNNESTSCRTADNIQGV